MLISYTVEYADRSLNVMYQFKQRLEKEFIPEREALPATNM